MEVCLKLPVNLVIPVHNRKNITLACLANLNVTGDLARYHVVVVDDGSTDGTAAAIQQIYPDVEILTGDGNLWWTGAIELGMEYADRQGAKYLIWLNDDCLPEVGTLTEIVAVIQSNHHSIVGAACYCMESNAPFPTGFRGRTSLMSYPDQVNIVDGVSGYCVGMSSDVIAKIGLPDAKRFPHYGGDGMYTLKASRAGFQVCILGKAKAKLVGEVKPPDQFADSLKASNYDLSSVFWSKKSPFYLPFKFFYHIEKYGWLVGMALFAAKLIWWLCLYLKGICLK